MELNYLQLECHPDTPSLAVSAVGAVCWFEDKRWRFRYLVEGAHQLVLLDALEGDRADQLWQSTCFEAFIAGDAAAYREYNFAPSGQWATYAFDSPREGMRAAADEAKVWLEGGETWIAVEAEVSADLLPGLPFNLTAVIEESGGTKSYWALAHPSGPPNFHDPSCFIARLPE
ncbi:DOMON-like domain-containing protein [Sphingomonas sp.]|uniref:DOMON-like domain-containing protein n=1 Tax=Sphingomonas sp. TaxID=28214 RepID=UPI00286A3BCD|nr:DOMON-like domain-containing protein [Sphingomonas sp.]